MPVGIPWKQTQELDGNRPSPASRQFEDTLRQKIVGHEEGMQAIVELYLWH
jgi:hypothetical protein